MTSKTFDTEAFLRKVRSVKEDFHIRKVKQSNERSRRRVTILVVNEYLLAGGDIHRAFYLEADLYKELKKENLSCDPTEEEIRSRRLPRRKDKRIKHFNLLKLVSENFVEENKISYPLTEKIIHILTKEDEDGLSTDNIRRRTSKIFKHFQKDTCLFEKQKGLSLYRANKV